MYLFVTAGYKFATLGYILTAGLIFRDEKLLWITIDEEAGCLNFF